MSNLSGFDLFVQWQTIFTSLQTWIDLIYISSWRKNIWCHHIIEIAILQYRSFIVYINIFLICVIEIYICSWRKNILRLYLIEIAILKYRSYSKYVKIRPLFKVSWLLKFILVDFNIYWNHVNSSLKCVKIVYHYINL